MPDPLAQTGEALTDEAGVGSSFRDGLINSDLHSHTIASGGDLSRTSIFALSYSAFEHTALDTAYRSVPLSASVCCQDPHNSGWPFPTCTVLCPFFHPEVCTVYFVFLYTCPDLIQIYIFDAFHELIVLNAVLGALGLQQNQDRHTPQRLTSRRADRRGKRQS